MEILAIIPYSPSLIRTRSYNLLLSLVKRGHGITLATLWENPADQKSLSDLERSGIEVIAVPLRGGEKLENVIRGVFSKEPVQAHFSFSPHLTHKLEQIYLTRKPDLIHVEHLRGSLYALWAKKFFRAKSPILWDSVDSISLLFERMIRQGQGRGIKKLAAQLELHRTTKFEGWLVNQFNMTIAVAREDKLHLERLAKIACSQYNPRKHPINILSNGINLDTFFTSNTRIRTPVPKIVFSGKMSYHANEAAAFWLIREIMPIVWRERPDAIVQLVGASPGRRLLELAKKNSQRIFTTGYVPDIVPYLQDCTMAVAPIIYGTGIQNKVIEAMACGAPVIATSQAVIALGAEADKDVLIADEANSFAKNILQLIHDPILREQLSFRGRQYVQQNHDWELIIQEYERMIGSLVYATK